MKHRPSHEGLCLFNSPDLDGHRAYMWRAGASSARRALLRALGWGSRLALKEKPTKPNQTNITKASASKHNKGRNQPTNQPTYQPTNQPINDHPGPRRTPEIPLTDHTKQTHTPIMHVH